MLRKSGATPLRPFMAWTEKTSRFTLHRYNLTKKSSLDVWQIPSEISCICSFECETTLALSYVWTVV